MREVDNEVLKTYLDLLRRSTSISKQMELLDNEYHVSDFIDEGIKNGTFKVIKEWERKKR